MIAQVWACDVPIAVGTVTQYGMASAHPCPATSRAARSDEVLRLVAGRDGWVLLPDGTHRCPFHAGATT